MLNNRDQWKALFVQNSFSGYVAQEDVMECYHGHQLLSEAQLFYFRSIFVHILIKQNARRPHLLYVSVAEK